MAPLEERNKAIVLEYFAEFWGKANPNIVDKLCSDDFVINYPMHGPRYGKAEAKRMLSEFKEVSSRRGFAPDTWQLTCKGFS